MKYLLLIFTRSNDSLEVCGKKGGMTFSEAMALKIQIVGRDIRDCDNVQGFIIEDYKLKHIEACSTWLDMYLTAKAWQVKTSGNNTEVRDTVFMEDESWWEKTKKASNGS